MHRRFVLLGASNVAIAFPRLLEGLLGASEGPVEVFAAFGHGRSFGLTSRVLGRELTGLLECGLWQALEARPPAPARALLTDVGNDLLFGASVETLAGWVEDCLQRLAAAGAETVLTLPPATTVNRLPGWRYSLLRSVLFPGSRDTFAATRRRILRLGEELAGLGAKYGVEIREPDESWFGVDPIHIRPLAQRRAWEQILSSWPEAGSLPWPGWRTSLNGWLLPPATRRLWGRQRLCPQPHVLGDGSRLFLF